MRRRGETVGQKPGSQKPEARSQKPEGHPPVQLVFVSLSTVVSGAFWLLTIVSKPF